MMVLEGEGFGREKRNKGEKVMMVLTTDGRRPIIPTNLRDLTFLDHANRASKSGLTYATKYST